MSLEITREEIESLYDKTRVELSVREAVLRATATPSNFIVFLSRYANLNAWFGSGVASLAGKIGRSRGVFIDPDECVLDIADRSVLVASYFFDAARDEFDDRDTEHRDTHRCLAQACIKGAIFFQYGRALWKPEEAVKLVLEQSDAINEHIASPDWLLGIGERVAQGYGVKPPHDMPSLFFSMGYHVGSEILADYEFSHLDEMAKASLPDLVNYLSNNEFKIGDTMHNGYAWLSLHSGHGASKEVDHFNWATRGVREAFRYVDFADHAFLKEQVYRGIRAFVRDHQDFFANVIDR